MRFKSYLVIIFKYNCVIFHNIMKFHKKTILSNKKILLFQLKIEVLLSFKMSRKPYSKDVQISKTLSYLLRHGAVKEKLPITAG